MLRFVIAAAMAAASFSAADAATLLDGKTVGIQYYFPTSITLYENTGTVTVGVDGPKAVVGGLFSLSFTDNSIIASQFGAGSWTPASFNGFRVYDVNNSIADFTSVTLSASNMVGLDSSRITFDADNVYVNWQGLAFDGNTSVTLSINGAAAVPEPATWAMMIAGFGMVGSAMRRRRMTAVAA